MVFRPNVVLRLLLWISIIAVGQFPLVCSAQAAAKNQAQMRRELSAAQNELKSLKDSLTADERKIDALQASPPATEDQRRYLKDVTAAKSDLETEKSALENLEKEIRDSEQTMATNQLGLSNNYYTIFGSLAAILVALGAGLGVVIYRLLYEALKARLEKEIIGRARYEGDLRLAETYSQQAYTWFEHYEPEYQKVVRNTPIESQQLVILARETGLAQRLADRGLKICEVTSIKNHKHDNDAWVMSFRLTNLRIYNRTAELVCQRALGEQISAAKISEVLSWADDALSLALEEPAREFLWYEMYQTAAFALVLLGNQQTSDYGRTVLRGLFSRHPPAQGFKRPPREWRLERWNEYFWTDTGGVQHDHLQLGPIPLPT